MVEITSYILYVWTAIFISAAEVRYEWKPIGEFHSTSSDKVSAKMKCENAAKRLEIPPIIYECIRSR
jgi:hypothetical protein